MQDQYSSQSSPINANQGVNAGFLGSPQRLESNALGDDDDFQDAFETPAESFTTGDAAYGSANNNDAAYGSPSANNRGYGSANNAGYGSANNTGYVSTANSNRQPYVNQTGIQLLFMLTPLLAIIVLKHQYQTSHHSCF